MHPTTNPFAPGAGDQPPTLAGRDDVLAVVGTALDRAELGRRATGMVLYGLRGTGKTVLLNRIAEDAAERQWAVALVEAAPDTDLATLVGSVLAPHVATLEKSVSQVAKRAVSMFRGFSLEFGIGLGSVKVGTKFEPERLWKASGQLDRDLPTLLVTVAQAHAEQAADSRQTSQHGRQPGLLLAVDEVQDLERGDLAALCVAAQRAAREKAPLLVCAAGLLSAPRKLADAKSYAERLFDYERVGYLTEDEARRALVEPVERLGEAWSDGALDIILESAGGYPYFLQHFGAHAWRAADFSPISRDAALAARKEGFRALDEGFFLARWSRATENERDLMRALNPAGDESEPWSAVADRAGVPGRSLAPVRATLTAKGIVFTPAPGRIAFTSPGMATFVRRADEHGW